MSPSTDGPRTIPAIISPITGGWPIQRNSLRNNPAIVKMTIICVSRMLRGF